MSKEIIERLPKELQTSFYRDNPKKIFVLSMISCGYYDLLWFYRHWRHFKRRSIGLNEIKQQELDICSKDKDIIPFWSTFFCGFYIVGTARRIRDKMKSAGFSNYAIGPWWAFFLFGNDSIFAFFQGTSDINLNVMIYIIGVLLVAISTWQITRLQIKANEYMTLSNECENVIEVKYKKWDIFICLIGFVLGFFNLIGTILPS